MKWKWLFFFGIVTLMRNIALSGVWIVCDDDGSNPVVTPYYVVSLFKEANVALRQAAMTFTITENDIQYINRSAWRDLNRTNTTFRQTLRDMRAIPRSGALRIFFVNTYNGSFRTGFNDDYCMVVAKNISGVSLAHEICHAAGLRDIYITQDGVSIADAGVVKEAHVPLDWSGDYYPHDLQHTNLITRLLMYGYVREHAVDIPLGRVYGVYRPRGSGGLLPPTKGMAPVGIQDLNRQPQHLD